MFFVLGLASYAIEIPFCEAGNVTLQEWTCYNYIKREVGLGWIGYMFGILSLIYGIVNAITASAETLERK